MSPGAANSVVRADFVIVRAGVCPPLTVSVTSGDVVVPSVAEAIFVTLPASISAWVTL